MPPLIQRILRKIPLYAQLMRLEKPVGFVLLAWPCLWGIALANRIQSSDDHGRFILWVFLFMLGALIMRSFGCVINDIADRHIDAKVSRTQNRPLAAKKITIYEAFIVASILCFFGFFIFLTLPQSGQILSILALFFAILYPFSKRWTNHPQIILGMAYNSGVLIAFCTVAECSIQKLFQLPAVFFLMFAGVCWTVAYDTIYAFQDLSDDRKIGVKSTAICYQNNPKKWVGMWYVLSLMGCMGMNHILHRPFLSLNSFGMIIWIIAVLCFWDPHNPSTSGKWFRYHMMSSIIFLL